VVRKRNFVQGAYVIHVIVENKDTKILNDSGHMVVKDILTENIKYLHITKLGERKINRRYMNQSVN
jgi:hypothetical protein